MIAAIASPIVGVVLGLALYAVVRNWLNSNAVHPSSEREERLAEETCLTARFVMELQHEIEQMDVPKYDRRVSHVG